MELMSNQAHLSYSNNLITFVNVCTTNMQYVCNEWLQKGGTYLKLGVQMSHASHIPITS